MRCLYFFKPLASVFQILSESTRLIPDNNLCPARPGTFGHRESFFSFFSGGQEVGWYIKDEVFDATSLSGS